MTMVGNLLVEKGGRLFEVRHGGTDNCDRPRRENGKDEDGAPSWPDTALSPIKCTYPLALKMILSSFGVLP